MSRQTFSVAYDGAGLRDGAMDVRDLAPALLAVGQLLDAANRTLNGDQSHVRVQVRATSPGSFQIELELLQGWVTSVLDVFTTPSATGVANLLQIVLGTGALTGAVASSLIWLVRRVRGRMPDRVERGKDDTVILVFGDETITVPLALLRLYQDIAVRDALQKVVEEPLKRDGIDEFKVLDAERHVVEHVRKVDAEAFAKPSLPDEVLTDSVRRSAFSIVSLAFKEDNKWRLFDGNTNITAAITDADFLQSVDQNMAFSKGDILICDVRVTQKRSRDGLKTEYVVEKVVEHRPAARQLPLFPTGTGRGQSPARLTDCLARAQRIAGAVSTVQSMAMATRAE